MDWAELEQQIKKEFKNAGGRYVWTDVLLQKGHIIQHNANTNQYRLLDPDEDRLHLGDYDACKNMLDDIPAPVGSDWPSDHLVLLIHGMGRHEGIMSKPEAALKKAGFATHSLNYASLFEGVEEHANHFIHLIENLQGIKKISFVTHSLGGLVVREMLSRNDHWGDITAHRLVMMGTPNKGAQIAAFLSRLKAYHVISGPSGSDVLPDKLVKELPEPSIPTLVIAGGMGNDIGFNPLLDGDNDGIVTVNETRLDMPHDFIRAKVIHTIIMDHDDSINATVRFLAG